MTSSPISKGSEPESLKTIGLCLSGGGHRATMFCLGALLYLVDAGRHRDVRVISSVSGGSLTSGFLSVQSRPLHEMEPAEFEACAARLARQIAGSPTWWWIAILGQFLLFLAWLSRLPDLLGFLPGWWQPQGLYLAASLLWAWMAGPRVRGSFWGWWGTWFYLSLVLPSIVLLIFIWWSPLSWWWCVAVSVTAAITLARRNWIADLAFRSTLCQPASCGSDPTLLSSLPTLPRYVFCATEMQTGRHAFFSHDLIYSTDRGLGLPAKLPLSTAVQVSANFPGAFPYRILDPEIHEFSEPPSLQRGSLVLSDGGVYDNMAAAWFLEAPDRGSSLRAHLDALDSFGARSNRGSAPWPSEALRQRVRQQVDALKETPDLLIAINCSSPVDWSAARFSRIPILGELATLIKVQSIMYNRLGREQSAHLRRLFFASSRGAMVGIEESPDTLTRALATEPGPRREALLRDTLPSEAVERFGNKARTLEDHDTLGPDHEKHAAEKTARVSDLQGKLDKLRQAASREPQESARGAELEMEIFVLESALWREEHRAQTYRLEKRIERLHRTTRLIELTGSSNRVPTTFRPLGLAATSALLEHGYLTCMNNCSVLLTGFPRFAPSRSVDAFRQLAGGHPRPISAGVPTSMGQT